MARQADPLTCIPSADIVRRQLTEAEQRAERLRILLEVAEKIEAVKPTRGESAHAS
jgi:hypothetical protein